MKVEKNDHIQPFMVFISLRGVPPFMGFSLVWTIIMSILVKIN